MAVKAEREVASLLEAALTLEGQSDQTKKDVLYKRRECGDAQDRIIEEASKTERKLETEGDRLLARLTALQGQLEFLRRDRGADTEKQRVALRKTDADTEELHWSFCRLRTALTLKQAPTAEMLTPPCTFDIDDYEERKANNEVWYSPPFYSHSMGYKMCLQVYPNGHGNGRGTHVSAYLMILPGEFDDLLLWPFCGKITIQLINQRKAGRGHISQIVSMTTENSLHARQRADPKQAVRLRDFSEKRPARGRTQFAAHGDLKPQGLFPATEYLKDNKLLFRIWKVDRFFLHY